MSTGTLKTLASFSMEGKVRWKPILSKNVHNQTTIRFASLQELQEALEMSFVALS